MSKVKRISISIYPDELEVVTGLVRTVPGIRNTSSAIQYIIREYSRLQRQQTPAPTQPPAATPPQAQPQ